MKAYEYYAKIMPDGHLSLPEDFKNKIKGDTKIRVMMLIEEDEAAWKGLSMSQLLIRIFRKGCHLRQPIISGTV